jgi:hypothetical protein
MCSSYAFRQAVFTIRDGPDAHTAWLSCRRSRVQGGRYERRRSNVLREAKDIGRRIRPTPIQLDRAAMNRGRRGVRLVVQQHSSSDSMRKI